MGKHFQSPRPNTVGSPCAHRSHLFAIWPLRTEMHNPANFSLAAKSLDLWLSTPESERPRGMWCVWGGATSRTAAGPTVPLPVRLSQPTRSSTARLPLP